RLAARAGGGAGRGLGARTTLDTAPVRSLVAAHSGGDSRPVHGDGIGEHGGPQVLTRSLATPGGGARPPAPPAAGGHPPRTVRKDIDEKVRRAAYTIIAGKGATYYGVGSALARVVEAVIHDQRSILTVCAPAADVAGVKDVTVSLPRLVGGAGVIETFPLPL